VWLTGEWLAAEWLPAAGDDDAGATPPSATPHRVKGAWPFLLFAFADAAGGTLVALRAPVFGRSFGADEATIGLLVAGFSIAQMASAVSWGRLSDLVGRRRVLSTGLFLIAGSLLLLVAARRWELLLLARVVHGLGSGTLGVVVAGLLDDTPTRARAGVLGQLGAATSAGTIAGSVFSRLDTSRWALPVALPIPEGVMLVLLAVVLVPVWLRITDRIHPQPVGRSRAEIATATSSFDRATWLLLGTYMLAAAAASGIPPMLPVLLTADRAGPSPATALMTLGVLGLILRSVLVVPLVGRWGDLRVLRGGLIAMAAAVATLGIADRAWLVWLSIVLLAMATMLTFPSLGALLAFVSNPMHRGVVMGMQHAVGGFARASMPLAIGASVGGAYAVGLLCTTGAALVAVSASLRSAAFREFRAGGGPISGRARSGG
jgi:MFS family permease